MLAPRLRRAFGLSRRTFLHPPIASWVAANASGVVLDIDCPDRWAEKRLSPDCRYTGIDYLVRGRAMYGSRPDACAGASMLPIADASVDTVVLSIPIINVLARGLGRLLPSWDSVAAGYRLVATKA